MDISKVFSLINESTGAEDLYASNLLKGKNKAKVEKELGLQKSLISYGELVKVADFLNVNIENLYISRNPFDLYCYLDKDLGILLSLYDGKIETLKELKVKEQIKFQRLYFKELFEKKDYVTLFYTMNSKIKIMMLNKLSSKIPDKEIYEVFTSIYPSLEYGFNKINKKVIERVKENKPTNIREKISEISSNKKITIYRGVTQESTSLKDTISWTTNLDVALFFATRFGRPQANVYSAEVSTNDVIAFVDRGESEILVKFEALNLVNNMDLLNFEKLPHLYSKVIDRYDILKLNIKDSLFFEPNGIHGTSHAKRVLFLTLLLSEMENLNHEDKDILTKSALYHDIGRENNGICLEHGKKSYKKMRKENLVKEMKSEDRKLLRYIVENHCIGDNESIPINKYEIKDEKRARDLLNIFKDADGLDRVRIKDLDTSYLRTKSSKKLLIIAHQLLQVKL